jgi:CBS domain-containing protein
MLSKMPRVKDFMTKGVLTIEPEKSVFEAAELMTMKEVGDIIVVGVGMPKGIVTERDFVRRVIAKQRPPETKISDVMTTPLITIDPEASLSEAAQKMINNRIRRLPVIEKNRVVGIITVSDFAKHVSKKSLSESVLEAIWRGGGAL